MPMVPFPSLVGEPAFKDMRTVIVMKGKALPADGEVPVAHPNREAP
jgi:hypothetical protein